MIILDYVIRIHTTQNLYHAIYNEVPDKYLIPNVDSV